MASSSAQTPIRDRGIVTIGIRTDRNEPRNSRMTMTTIATASPIVLKTSSIDAVICSVEL